MTGIDSASIAAEVAAAIAGEVNPTPATLYKAGGWSSTARDAVQLPDTTSPLSLWFQAWGDEYASNTAIQVGDRKAMVEAGGVEPALGDVLEYQGVKYAIVEPFMPFTVDGVALYYTVNLREVTE